MANQYTSSQGKLRYFRIPTRPGGSHLTDDQDYDRGKQNDPPAGWRPISLKDETGLPTSWSQRLVARSPSWISSYRLLYLKVEKALTQAKARLGEVQVAHSPIAETIPGYG